MRFIKKHLKFFLILLVLSVAFLAYGQTLRMYFWQDDSALIFRLQHPEGLAGSFGTNIWERGAYRYLVVPFVPFFPLFGLNPFGYFLVGFLTYLLATGSFYLFSKELLKNTKSALFTTLIFAAGYVSSNTMFRVINSWQTNVGLLLAMLTFWIYIKFLRSNQLITYILSLVLFLATIELVYIRSHSLILPILAIDILFKLFPFKIKELVKLIIRQIPFWLLFKYWYLEDSQFGGGGIRTIFEQVILNGQIEGISPLFANIGNIFIPDILQSKFELFLIYILNIQTLDKQILIIGTLLVLVIILVTILLGKINQVPSKLTAPFIFLEISGFFANLYFFSKNLLWYRDIQSVTSGLIGIELSILIFYITIYMWKQKREAAIGLIFGWILISSQIFGYFTQYPTAIFNTTHRYFSHSFIGYSLILGVLSYIFYLWFSKNFKKIPLYGYSFLAVILVTNLFLGIIYQNKFVNEISIPTRNFYQNLKTFVPNIEKGSIFYFDIVDDGFYKNQFGNFFSVGSMPESTAIAIYYGLDRYDISMLTDFNEFAFELSKEPALIDKIYTFFYDQTGLKNTTSKFRTLFKNETSVIDIKPESESNIASSTVRFNNLNISSLTPLLLTFTLEPKKSVTPEKFPYFYNNPQKIEQNLGEKENILKYLRARENYFRTVKVASLSEWKFREAELSVDKDPSTTFQGHRIYWHDNKHEQLTVDLGEVRDVNRIAWINWNNTLTPTTYTLESSMEGSNWQKLKVVNNGPERKSGEQIIEEFPNTKARFIRMDITGTLTDDSPAITEVEVINSEFNMINPATAVEVLNNPFGFVANEEEWDKLFNLVDGIAQISITRQTDKDDLDNTKLTTPLYLSSKEYSVILPAGGTHLEDITISTNIPVDIKIKEAKLKNLSLEEMKNLGLILEFKDN